MQDLRTGYPSFEGRANAFPAGPTALTTTAQTSTAIDHTTDRGNAITLVGYRVRRDIGSSHDEGFSRYAHRIYRLMHPLTQLRLDSVQRCTHTLRHSPAADSKMALGVRRAIMREPKKGERLWFSLTTLLPVNLRKPTKLDQPRLLRIGVPTQSLPAVHCLTGGFGENWEVRGLRLLFCGFVALDRCAKFRLLPVCPEAGVSPAVHAVSRESRAVIVILGM